MGGRAEVQRNAVPVVPVGSTERRRARRSGSSSNGSDIRADTVPDGLRPYRLRAVAPEGLVGPGGTGRRLPSCAAKKRGRCGAVPTSCGSRLIWARQCRPAVQPRTHGRGEGGLSLLHAALAQRRGRGGMPEAVHQLPGRGFDDLANLASGPGRSHRRAGPGAVVGRATVSWTVVRREVWSAVLHRPPLPWSASP